MTSTIQVRVDDNMKADTDVSANPFYPMSEEELYKKLEASRLHATQGNVRYAGEVVSDMRTKYGL
jgi:DNA-damage-inducible protein J